MILTSSDITAFWINFNFKMITVIKENTNHDRKIGMLYTLSFLK